MDSSRAVYFYSDLSPNLSQQGFRENWQIASLCVSWSDTLTHTESKSSFTVIPSALPAVQDVPINLLKPPYFLPRGHSLSRVASISFFFCCFLRWGGVVWLLSVPLRTGSKGWRKRHREDTREPPHGHRYILCFFTDTEDVPSGIDILSGFNTATQPKETWSSGKFSPISAVLMFSIIVHYSQLHYDPWYTLPKWDFEL